MMAAPATSMPLPAVGSGLPPQKKEGMSCCFWNYRFDMVYCKNIL
jgi:hypothetical protein